MMSQISAEILQNFNSRAPIWLHRILNPLYKIKVSRAGKIWATRDNNSDGLRPNQYVELDAKARILSGLVASEAKDKDAAILDIACNSGRHLYLLYQDGFRNLHGVDINPHSIAYSAEIFADMQPSATMTASTVESYLEQTASNKFAVSFTRGTSIEFVSPAYPLVKEICRVTRDACVLLVHPAAPPFPRLWPLEFEKSGFYLESLQHLENEILYCFRRKSPALGSYSQQ